MTAPSVTGGDLLTELEALRKPTTEGLSTTEINFQRAAIGFSYSHWNKCPKINFEMRFHRNFIENGLVFVEVIQKDSPLSADKAILFLTLLQQESDDQVKATSSATVLSRTLQQLPRLIESMKIFTPSIEIAPNAQSQTTANSSLSGSADEQLNLTEMTDEPSRHQTMSISYTPSPYDDQVPAPRISGARFNGSGFLVLFGQATFALPRSRRKPLPADGDERAAKVFSPMSPAIPRAIAARQKKATMGRNTELHTSESERHTTPRSLAEYAIWVAPYQPALSTTYERSSRRTITDSERYSVSGTSPSSGGVLMPPTLSREPSAQSATAMPISAVQRNASIKSATKLSTSPCPALPPVANRSISLQNMSQGMRHRGSSMCGTLPEQPCTDGP